VMGLLVGIVVAGQVLYTSTLEHLKEYGTLKAMGASNSQVSSAIISQAMVGALPAHVLAGGLLLIARNFIGGKGIHLSIDFNTYMLAGTVVVCIAASMLSVWKVMKLEPAEVFKG
jgi:putative ABC transport system permease protein